MRVPTGPAKYKRAAEFLMNTMLGSIKAIVARIIAERDAAAKRGTDEAAAAAQVPEWECKGGRCHVLCDRREAG